MAAILKSEVDAVILGSKSPSAKSLFVVDSAMRDAAKYLLKRSQELVPTDSGRLAASGRIESHNYGFAATIDVVYGDENAYYAVFVHENLLAVHGDAFNAKYAYEIAMGREHPRRSQEQAKFLQEPLADLSPIRTAFNKSVERFK